MVVLTTSSDEQDVQRSYQLGASSFITKPVSFIDLVKAIGTFTEYWFQTAGLPNNSVGQVPPEPS